MFNPKFKIRRLLILEFLPQLLLTICAAENIYNAPAFHFFFMFCACARTAAALSKGRNFIEAMRCRFSKICPVNKNVESHCRIYAPVKTRHAFS